MASNNTIVNTSINQLTLLAFVNSWCAQCYTERPIIQKIADEYQDQLKAKLVNVDDQPTLVSKYSVKTAPSIVLLKNGRIVERISRFIDHSQLESLVRYYL